MEISVTRIDKTNAEHERMFGVLFSEYMADEPVEFDLSVVRHLFTLPYFHGFMTFVDGQPAGCAVCFESYSTHSNKNVMNIHDFMVSGKFRGKGLGKAQLTGIEQYCRENNYVKITLEVAGDNEVAKKLYRSCEFEDFNVFLKDQLHWQKYLK
ncbi:GNAT family N-acetyltransferase [Enterovibrio paralichthyis]|uniref:GNAT family N-acetyltransferase n=1 Tax=Enterovibrio paralichthyis TaxID=2853805 RepID=UPI001C473A74|nr:GNAT family N-acetyltransferase [Enterovibrio paralichthyis]MBV7298398.1 GNAT family N-acetyltransferase [Enterovibrio paralichthyis]